MRIQHSHWQKQPSAHARPTLPSCSQASLTTILPSPTAASSWENLSAMYASCRNHDELRSLIIAFPQAYRGLFQGPTAVVRDAGLPGRGRGSLSRSAEIKQVRPPFIAYVATLVSLWTILDMCQCRVSLTPPSL